ncbi:alpha-galactosidase 3 [Tanacetum coccineum]
MGNFNHTPLVILSILLSSIAFASSARLTPLSIIEEPVDHHTPQMGGLGVVWRFGFGDVGIGESGELEDREETGDHTSGGAVYLHRHGVISLQRSICQEPRLVAVIFVAKVGTDQLVPDPKTFPSGIKALADYVHDKGLKLGIYSSAGVFTCQVRPASLFHENDDAATWASWGVDYLKYDNCFNLGIKPIDRYPPMRDALNSTGRKIFYSLCEWGEDDPALWAGDVGNSWRTTDDIEDTWARSDHVRIGPTSYWLWNIHLEFRRKVLTCFGTDVSPRPSPLKSCNRWLDGWVPVVWAGPLSGNRFAVVLWNRCSEAGTIEVSWNTLGLESSIGVSVRDLWKHEDVVADAVASFGVPVEAHSCEMLFIYHILEDDILCYLFVYWREHMVYVGFQAMNNEVSHGVDILKRVGCIMGVQWYGDVFLILVHLVSEDVGYSQDLD